MSKLTIGPVDRLVVLGGTALAVEIAKLAQKWRPHTKDRKEALIITSPRQLPEVETLAKQAGIRVEALEDIGAAGPILGDMSRTFVISVGAAWIFKPAVIEGIFGDRLFNLHGMRLPQYRGGGNWSWQVLTGNRLGFCLIHKVDGGIDTGEIVEYSEFLYPPACRVPEDFIKYYEDQNLHFMERLMDRLFSGPVTFQLKPQIEYLSAYWPRLNTKLQAWIDWNWSALELERFICAFDDPYPGVQTYWNDKPVSLKKVQTDFNDVAAHPFQSGIVYRNNGQWLLVAARGGSLIVELVLNEKGENILPNIKPGDRLHTPAEKLDAKSERVIYTPRGLKAS